MGPRRSLRALGGLTIPRDVTFYGASDDLLVCEDKTGGFVEEVGCYAHPGAFVIEDFGNEGLQVVGAYSPEGIEGCGQWMIGVAQLDEDAALPDWPVRFGVNPEHGYSPVLTITVPDTAKVRVAKVEED